MRRQDFKSKFQRKKRSGVIVPHSYKEQHWNLDMKKLDDQSRSYRNKHQSEYQFEYVPEECEREKWEDQVIYSAVDTEITLKQITDKV